MVNLVRVASAMLVAGVILGAAPAWAQAPSLAEVARKEAERRKAIDKAGKTYTNADLESRRPLTTMGAPAPAAPAGPAAGQDKTEKADPMAAAEKALAAKAAEAATRRLAGLRDEKSTLEDAKDQAYKRVNELNAQVLNVFDQTERERLVQERDATIAEIRRLDVDIAAQSKVISELESAVAARKPAGPPQ